jgi:hypothetical protein
MVAHDDTAIVEGIFAICAEFEFYGWRRVRAELRHRGLIVNHKKIRRLMREHDLQPRRRVASTDSDHNQPIHPNRAKDMTINGPNQLWVAEIFASPFLLVDPASRGMHRSYRGFPEASDRVLRCTISQFTA